MSNTHNKLPEETLIAKCNELNLRYIRSAFENKRRYVYFECEKHKYLGEQRIAWYHLKDAVKGCKYCAGKQRTSRELQMDLDERDVPVTILGEYISAKTKIECRCNLCGSIFSATPNSLLNKQACPECGLKRRAEKRRKDDESFIKDLAAVQPNIEIVGKYNGSHKLIKCRCRIDGYTWESYPANLLNRSAGCAVCCNGISRGELEVKSYLERNGIEYYHEYSFPDCRRIHALRFDFFLPNDNTAIEFDGRQHFEPVNFCRSDENSFQITQERDRIKNEYCIENGITLIRIPYYELNNIKDILDSKLKITKESA